MKNFLQTHALNILQEFENEITKPRNSMPLEMFLKKQLKIIKGLGTDDRFVISDAVYTVIRQKFFLDVITPKPVTWKKRLEMIGSTKFTEELNNPSIPLAARCSCPQNLFDMVAKEYTPEKTFEYMKSVNEKAPLTIRINPLKTTRKDIFEVLRKKHKFKVKKCDHSPLGIQFQTEKNVSLLELEEYRLGKFEIQDEGNQLVSLRVDCQAQQKVLDFCSGSGSKSLAFGTKLKGTGQIYLHDIRERVLEEAKKRFKRAGIQNVQFHTNTDKLKEFYHKMDWVVLDMPCTGTGLLRRNPDFKMKFSPQRLPYYLDLQEKIFDDGIKYLTKQGRIVYITSSLLPQENLEQVIKFCKKYNLEIENNEQFLTWIDSTLMDTYYSVTLKFK